MMLNVHVSQERWQLMGIGATLTCWVCHGCRGASSGQAGKLIRASADVWRALSRAAGRHKASRAAAPGLLMPPATFFSQVLPETQMAGGQVAESQEPAAAGGGGPGSSGSSEQERQQELLQSLEAADLQEEEEEEEEKRWQQAAPAGQLAASPVSLLDGICWAVTQPPSAASFSTSSGFQGSGHNQWQGAGAGSGWASQGYGSSQAMGGSQLATGQQELEQVLFRGSSITLLLPVTADQLSGVAARTYRLVGAAGGALTCGQLLQQVYEHYQQEAPHEELLQLLQHDAGARVAVRGLVQAGEAVVRGDLLGASCACDGLRRVGPSSSAVYQLQLTQ
jgi:hypothetical protein